MTDKDQQQTNKAVARAFVAGFNAGDIDALEQLLADDFVWHTAVIGDEETQPRPFQSAQLAGMENSIYGPLLKNRSQTRALFEVLFGSAQTTGYGFGLHIVSLIAEGDRVAMEVEGSAVNPANGRHYRNLYCVLMLMCDAKIVRYKEYQDTLHIYDVFVAE